MLPQKTLKIMFSKLAEIDFPGIKQSQKVRSEKLFRFGWIHEILSHARETAQESASLTANPRDLVIMTMCRYIKHWLLKI